MIIAKIYRIINDLLSSSILAKHLIYYQLIIGLFAFEILFFILFMFSLLGRCGRLNKAVVVGTQHVHVLSSEYCVGHQVVIILRANYA